MESTDAHRSIRKRVAICGGGIAGLAAAWYLQSKAPDTEVHLFEKSNRMGGVIQTRQEASWMIEMGADNFATLQPDALQLVDEMGLREEMIHPNLEHRLARVVRNNQLLPIPQGFSLMQPTRMDAILASRVLSWRGKLRVLAEYFVPARRDSSDESLEAFAVRRLGREAYRRLVEPIVGGIFTARGETLSMQAAMPQFVEMERRHGGMIRAYLAQRKTSSQDVSRKASGARYDQFLAPRQGMQWWLDQIEKRLSGCYLHRDTPILAIRKETSVWRLVTPTETADFDAVVIATPADPAARLLIDVLPQVSDELRQIPYASSAVVAMIVRKDQIAPHHRCFGVVVPAAEQRDVLAISMTSEKYPHRVPQDQVLLRVFMGGGVRPDLLLHTDQELETIACREVQSLFGMKSDPIWRSVFRWNHAMPQYLLGHRDRIQRIEESLGKVNGLALAGNAYRGVGIPQCIRSGRQAADRIVSTLVMPSV